MNVPPHASLRNELLKERDLERICFNQTDLTHCNFRNSKLRGARFKGCNLAGADFRNADLVDCIFEDSNLEGSDLRFCQLKNIRIVDCNLFAVNMDGSCLDNGIIDSCNMGAQSFHGSSCKGLRLYSSQVVHGFFDDADMESCELRNMEFRNCTLTNTSFKNALIDDCQFRGCESFQAGPIFSGAVLNLVSMSDTEFQLPKMVKTRITNSQFIRVDLDSCLMDGTLFDKVVFEKGEMKECYSLDQAPVFSHCRLDHLSMNQLELSDARFDRSAFVGAIIRDSDFSQWNMSHTGLDSETSIE
nr:pentapeptide repeat-containing protein [Endozoicomonas sp. OPT23]